jgi:hypothetical protein
MRGRTVYTWMGELGLCTSRPEASTASTLLGVVWWLSSCHDVHAVRAPSHRRRVWLLRAICSQTLQLGSSLAGCKVWHS